MTVTFVCTHEHRRGRCEHVLETTGSTWEECLREAWRASWFPLFRNEALCPEHHEWHNWEPGEG